MQKYSIFNLIKNAFSGHQNWDLAWKDPTPRTLDRLLTYASFQDWCIQPLCHPT